ncbi:hypothetical protein NDU88_003284 [Pleurodeles waltl]|uniref:Uncharacterized protein n=1 Tax=Pleurodeles waltl TaxID=8319 RepID=A0AAV7SEB5_PLEWA|nr:hypothetical protein NDU88_003284 [Pleurodeles waltl]
MPSCCAQPVVRRVGALPSALYAACTSFSLAPLLLLCTPTLTGPSSGKGREESAAPIRGSPGAPPRGPAVRYDAESATTELSKLQRRCAVVSSGPNSCSSVAAPGPPSDQGWHHRAAPIRCDPAVPPHGPAISRNAKPAVATFSGLQLLTAPVSARDSAACPHHSP